MKPLSTNSEPKVAEITDKVALDVEEIWGKASISPISHNSLIRKVRKLHDKYQSLMKSRNRAGTPKFDLNWEKILKETQKLFDIAACQCKSSSCKCDISRRVPIMERSFLEDQRTFRKMGIGRVDVKQTQVLQKRVERKLSLMNKNRSHEGERLSRIHESSSESDEYEPPLAESRKNLNELSAVASCSSDKHSQMRIHTPTLAKACDRYGISDRAAAAIASAVMQDIGESLLQKIPLM